MSRLEDKDGHGPAGDVEHRRPRILAGTTLGLAGVGAGLVLAMSATAASAGTGSVLSEHDGTVLLRLTTTKTFIAADRELAKRFHESYITNLARGAATHKGPVTCKPAGDPRPKKPRLQILVGKDGNLALHKGAGNTGLSGTYHLKRCYVYRISKAGNSGSGSSGR